MSREFNVENPGKSTFSIGFIRKKFHISSKKVVKILKYYDKKKRIFITETDLDGLPAISLYCPKLQELTDEYTQKLLTKKPAKVSGQTPEPCREQEVELELEVEVEVDNIDIDISSSFEKVWKIYPKKQGKTNAIKAYTKALKEGDTEELVMAGIRNYIKFVEHDRQNGFADRKFKDGSTFFNQMCWRDDFTIEEKPTTKPGECDESNAPRAKVI